MEILEKTLTEEQKKIYWANRQKTRELLNVPKGYHMHHKDTTLRHTDIERYIQWNPEDIEVLSPSEHIIFHNTGKSRKGINKGNPKNATATGRRWCNNGEINLYLKPDEELPEGFKYGRLGNENSVKAMNDYWKLNIDKRKGSNNPACRPEVKEKNRLAHVGKHRVYREDGSYYYS